MGYLNAVRIDRVIPQPEKVEVRGQEFIYHFAFTEDPVTITFHVEFQQFGVVRGRLGLAAGPMISFTQFVYP